MRIRFPESFRNYTPDYWFKMPISAHFFDRLMKSKTTITLSAMAIAAFVLLLASGPLVSDHQALAYRHYGGGHHGHYGHYGHYRGHHGGYGHYRGHYGGYGHYRGHYRR
ncbi:MAG: hypothetical protein WAJ93_16565 [Candidatus Nitrosopolaris sp.]